MNNSTLPLNITFASRYGFWQTVVIGVLATIMWIIDVVGNALVILAIVLDRRLKGIQHWYLASLAMADMLLGILVLPFSFTNQILAVWVFGPVLCQMWLVIDVLLCTASIINLSLISLDRYWSITRPMYSQTRTPKQGALFIALVWIVSAVICLPPLFGWSKPQKNEWSCVLTDNIGYVLYSTIGSFFIPMAIIIMVYVKIYWEARKRAHFSSGSTARYRSVTKEECSPTNPESKATVTARGAAVTEDSSLEISVGKETEGTGEKQPLRSTSNGDLNGTAGPSTPNSLPANDESSDHPTDSPQPLCESAPGGVTFSPDRSWPGRSPKATANFRARSKALLAAAKRTKRRRSRSGPVKQAESSMVDTVAMKKRKVAKSRERRATIVLGIILGAFIFCWFPFFFTYIVDCLCRCVSTTLFDVFFWIGYCNSAVNPIIYTVFNREFRSAFHRVITGRCR